MNERIRLKVQRYRELREARIATEGDERTPAEVDRGSRVAAATAMFLAGHPVPPDHDDPPARGR